MVRPLHSSSDCSTPQPADNTVKRSGSAKHGPTWKGAANVIFILHQLFQPLRSINSFMDVAPRAPLSKIRWKTLLDHLGRDRTKYYLRAQNRVEAITYFVCLFISWIVCYLWGIMLTLNHSPPSVSSVAGPMDLFPCRCFFVLPLHCLSLVLKHAVLLNNCLQ